MTFTHLRGFVVRSVAPVLFAALGFLALVAGEARAENDPDITVVLVATGPNTATATFSAPVNVQALTGHSDFASSALNPAHYAYSGVPLATASIARQTTLTANADGTVVTYTFLSGTTPVLIDSGSPNSGGTFFNTNTGFRNPTNIDPASGNARVLGFGGSNDRIFWPPLPSATLSGTLSETSLNGNTVVVNVEHTEFEETSGGLVVGNFEVRRRGGGTTTGAASGITIASLVRNSATRVTLTLGYDGAIDFVVATTIEILVRPAAHTGSGTLTTSRVAINTAPMITNPGAQTYLVNAPIDALAVTVSDSENLSGVMVTVAGLPSGLSYSAANSEITGTPDTVSEATVTITAAESGNDDITATFVISVVATLGVVEITAPSAAVAEAALDGTVVTLTFSATTLANTLPTTPPPFTLDAASMAAGITVAATPAPTRVSGTQATFTLAYTAVGGDLALDTTLAVSVIVAAEAHSLSGILTSTNTLAVTSTNQSPAFADGVTIPDQVYQQLNGFTLSLPAADGGNGALSYLLNPDAPNGMSVTNRVLSGAPTNLDRTGTTYQWVASDEDGDTAELAFTITVVEPLTFRFSTPPEASDLIYLVNETISLTLPEAQGGHDPLVYNAVRISAGDFAGLTFDPATRVVSGSRDTAGQVPLEYSVTDARPVTVDYSPALSLTIEVNTMPIFSQGQDIPDMVYIVNEAITPVTLPAVDPGTGNAPITHFFPTSTSPGLPPGLTFNAMTRVLSGTPDTEGTTNGIIYRAFDRNNDFTDKTTGNNEITFSITVVGPLAGLSVVRDLAVSERLQGTRPTVFLAWQAPAMVPSGVTITGYEIQSCRQNDFSDCTTQITVAGVGAVLRFEPPPRHWRVRALTAGGFSPWAEASLDAFTPSPTVAPGPVRSLASSGITDTGVTLTWLAPAVDADGTACVDFNDSPCGAGYVVRRGFPDGETPPGLILDPAPVEVSIGSLLTYTDAALLPGTAYLYEVYATNSALSGAPVRLAVTTTGTPGTIPTTITGDDTGAVTEGDGTAVVMLSGDLDDSSTAGDDNDFVLDEGTIGLYGTFTIGTDGAWVYTLIPERALALNTDDMVDDVFTVTATAPDAAGLTVTHTVTITVTGVNSPPNGLILVTDTTVEVGGTIVLGGGATDPDDRNTALTVEWTANGGTLINPVGAGIEWVATNGANSYTLTQTVTDPGGLSDTQDVTITVTGASPAAAITNIPLHEEALNGATMTVALINTQYENTLTPGLFTLDPDSSFTGLTVSSVVRDDATTATLTLAYTGSISSGADTELSVTVTNAAHTGAGDLTARSTLTVNADVAPTFGATTPIALTFVEAVPITPTRLPGATGGNGALTYSIAPSLPLGLALNPVTRFLTGTPTAGQTATTYTYTVTDSDPVTPDRADFTSAFSITIAAVGPLAIGGDTTGGVTEGDTTPITGDLTVTNSGDGGTNVVEQNDASGTYGTFSITAAGAWTYTLDNTNAAINPLAAGATLEDTFTVAAVADSTATVVITITITGVNDAPTVEITAPMGSPPVVFGEMLTLTATGADVDTGQAATLTYAWTANPNVGNFADATAASTTWTAPASGTDPVTLTLTATDAAGDTGTAQVIVNPEALVITFTGATTGAVNEGDTTEITGTLTVTSTGSDTNVVEQNGASGTYGTYSVTAAGVWTYTLDNTNAAINPLAAGATLEDTFTVAAVADNTATQVITITITGVNDAPTVTITAPTGSLPVVFSEMLTLTATGADVDTGQAATLTYAWTANPNVGSFADATAASTTWTAPASGADPVTLTLTATDDDATTPLTGMASVTVNPTAAAITFTGATTGAVNEGVSTEITGTLTVTSTGTNTDVVEQNDASGTYGTFSVTAAGVWTYTLDNTNAAINPLAAGETLDDPFTVVSAANSAATQVITITITGVNDAPTVEITAPTGSPPVVFSEMLTLTATGADVDTGQAATLTYAWTANPNVGVFADATAASTTWTAPASGTDPVTLTLTATDAAGDTGTAQVIVNPTAAAITFTGATTGGVTEDGTLTASGTLTVDSTGTNTDVVEQNGVSGTYGTFSVTAAGAWTYTLDNTNSAINPLAAGETLDDPFTVVSAANSAATQVITITITGVNDAPTVEITAPTGNREVAFSSPLTLTATGTDPDTTDVLTYAWTANPDVGVFADAAAASTTWTAPATGSTPVVLTLTVMDDATPPLSDTATVTITPSAVAITFDGGNTGGVNEGGTTATGTLIVTSTGINTDVVAQTDTTGTYGTFSITAVRVWTYTLDNTNAAINPLAEGETLDDTFTVAAADMDSTATVVVTITITGVNDAPTASITTPEPTASVTLSFGQRLSLVGSATDVDVGNTFEYAWTVSPNEGTFADSADSATTYHLGVAPTASVYTLTLTVTDNDGGVGTDTFVFNVIPGAVVTGNGVNDPTTPVMVNTIVEGGDANGTLTVMDIPMNQAGETLPVRHQVINTGGADELQFGTATIGTGMTRIVDATWTYTLDNSRKATKNLGPMASETDTFVVRTNIGNDIEFDSTITVSLPSGTFPNDPPDITFLVDGIPVDVVQGGVLTMNVIEGEEVTLDASRSLDPEGPTPNEEGIQLGLEFTWTYDGDDPEFMFEGGEMGTSNPPIGNNRMVTFIASDTPGVPTTEEFTLEIMDSGAIPEIARARVRVTITPNAPTFDIATILPQRYVPGEPISVTLPGATGGDGNLTYDLAPTAGGNLPEGLSFDDTTRVLSGTPTTVQNAVEYTYTVTDADNDIVRLTFTITIRNFANERALQKTLAAFGRAFAAGTVSIFEDYLSTPATSANTSHFTIGGHKFEMAADPAQTAPSFLNDRKTASDSDQVFHRIGYPVEPLPTAEETSRDLANTINSANLADTTTNGATTNADTPATTTTTLMSGQDLLMKSAFHFNFKGDNPTATSGWSLWARATTSNFDGKPEDDFEQDGDVTSAYLGADYHTPTGTRLGIAISETGGEIDYDDITAEAQGDLDADLTSILPYLQWQPSDTTNAWVVLGYGEGDAELATDRDDQTTEVDIEMQMIAAGVSGDLTTGQRSQWSWKASAFVVELESEADEATDLPAVTANSQRLRLALQGRAPGTLSPNGAQLTPNWELGLRWDDGDAEQGGGADLGLGFDYRHPASGLSMQGKASALVAHEEEDYDEWDASLHLRYDPGAQGRGITFTLEPGWTKDGRSQQMGMDFSNALGKWSKRGLRLELTGERTEKDDNDIGHNIRLTGSLRF